MPDRATRSDCGPGEALSPLLPDRTARAPTRTPASRPTSAGRPGGIATVRPRARNKGYEPETVRPRPGRRPFRTGGRRTHDPRPWPPSRSSPTGVTPTNTRLGSVFGACAGRCSARPGRRRARPARRAPVARRSRAGAVGARPSRRRRRDRAQLAALARRRARQARHGRDALGAGVPHPRTVHVAPWLPLPGTPAAAGLQAAFGSWGQRRAALRREEADRAALALASDAAGSTARAPSRRSSSPHAGTTSASWLRAAVSSGRCVRVAARASGARTSRSAHVVSRCCRRTSDRVALARRAATGGDLVGVDLLPADGGTWVVLEVNGAVDFKPLLARRRHLRGGAALRSTPPAAVGAAVLVRRRSRGRDFRPRRPACDVLAQQRARRVLRVAEAARASTSMIATQVSSPIRSASASGPIGWAKPSFAIVSIASGSATPSSSA